MNRSKQMECPEWSTVAGFNVIAICLCVYERKFDTMHGDK